MTGVPAHREQGAGSAVVFLHGVGGDAGCWAPELAHLAARHRALAWDMPGYGGSAPLEPMTFPALAAALVRLLDACGIDRAHVVGHSMGGMVALELMAAHAARVRSLVLMGTSPVFGSADGSFQREFLAKRLAPLDAGRSMAELAPQLVADMVGEAPDAGGVARAQAAMTRVSEATYRASLQCLTTFDRRAQLAGIAVPTLVVAGARDATAPPAGAERMAGRIAGARYVCLERAGHLMSFEQPASFHAVLDGFLDAQPREP